MQLNGEEATRPWNGIQMAIIQLVGHMKNQIWEQEDKKGNILAIIILASV